MPTEHPQGGYRYLSGLAFASAGVVSAPGHAIEHARFATPRPLEQGYDAVRRHLEQIGRPLEALCGLEIRMPAALPAADFKAFNAAYIAHLDGWGLLRDGRVPFARTNVAPRSKPPADPALLACSYTVETEQEPPGFIISGVAELPADRFAPAGVIRHGELTRDALEEKTRWILADTQARMRELGVTWEDADTVHLYWTNLDLFAVARELFDEAGIAPAHGFRWHDTAAPIVDLELEIDVRRYLREILIDA